MRLLPLGGTDALVSAPYHCSGGTVCTGFLASGAAHHVDVTTGAILQSFLNPSPGLFDVFGFGTAATSGRLFVSAMLDDDDGGAENGGTVYVYDAPSGTPVGSFGRSVPLAGAYFGYALAGDSGQVLVGVYKGGAVYLVDATTLAVVQTYLDPDPIWDSKSFGQAVALDAGVVVVGMPEGHVTSTPETGLWPGTVHVYERSTGAWRYTLEPPMTTSGFGAAVLLDGPRLVVGSNQAVFVYDLASGVLERTIPDPTGVEGSWFGNALAILSDRIVVGASGAPDGGKVYLVDGPTGTVAQTLDNPAPATAPGMGLAVATMGGSVLAGAGSIENPPPTVPGVFVFAPCGDGTLDPGEECDDENVAIGDGCSDRCSYDSTPTTTSSPSTTSTSSTTTTTTATVVTSTTFVMPTEPVAAILPTRQTVLVGQTVVLDGSASIDPRGEPLDHQWTLLSVPVGSAAVLQNASSARPTFVPDVDGVYEVELRVSAGERSSAAATTVTAVAASPLGLTITAPAEGSTVSGRRVRVHGTVSGPLDTGVTVNGRIALTNGAAFTTDAIPLVPGDNAIAATATTISGDTFTTSIRVSSQWQPQILKLRSLERSALEGKTVRFEFDFESKASIQAIAMDFDGDGTDEITTTDATTPLSFQYATAGLYEATLKIVDEDGLAHQAVVPVNVQALATLDPVFQGIWSGIREALVGGNVPAALDFVSPSSRSKFEATWAALLPQMSSIYASYSPLRGYDIASELATYFITRSVNGENRVYFIEFIRDGDGVWRLHDM